MKLFWITNFYGFIMPRICVCGSRFCPLGTGINAVAFYELCFPSSGGVGYCGPRAI
jgi:hypothetical protein